MSQDIDVPVTDPVVEVGEEQHDSGSASTPQTPDPVCGMSVDPASASASATHEGRTYSFCSQHCADIFDAEPDRYVSARDVE